jgi:hypothetical protein
MYSPVDGHIGYALAFCLFIVGYCELCCYEALYTGLPRDIFSHFSWINSRK